MVKELQMKALDEIDRWSEKMNRELEGLSTEQVLEYFNGAEARLEKSLGRPLNLPVRGARQNRHRPPD